MFSTQISRKTLAKSRVLFDEIDRNSINLARMLSGLGAQVRIVDARPMPDDLLDDCLELEKGGVLVEAECDPNKVTFDYDILFVALLSSPTSPYIVEARRKGKLVANLADLIFQISPVPTLGVTGSAGKSTTTTLIGEMLAASGQTTYIDRNIDIDGIALWPNHALLNQLEEICRPAWLVAELTSGHLEYMHTSPDVAVVTNLAPDHVEWHGSMENYLRAKETILRYQTSHQWTILNYDNDLTRQMFVPRCPGQVAYFSLTAELDRGVFLKDDHIVACWDDGVQTIASPADAQGTYLPNVLAACAGAIAAGASVEAIGQAIRDFRGLPQRRQLVGEVAGIRFVNDARAITPKKASASLASFTDQSLILIAGGHTKTRHDPQGMHNRDEERAELRAACRLAAQKAKAIVLFDESAPVLQEHLLAEGYAASKIHRADCMRSAFREAVHLATAGDTVLVAPIFRMHWHEGTAFEAMVSEYANEINQ